MTTSITPSNELVGIRELLAKATPGPWQWVQGHCHDPEQWSLSPGVLMADERDGTPGGDEIDRANAELIALAPTLAAENLTLSTRIKELEEENVRLRDELEHFVDIRGQHDQ